MRLFIGAIIFFMVSCTQFSKERAEKDLHILLKDDLTVIVQGLDSSLLLAKPSYRVVNLKWYEKSKYSCNVSVDYFFLKDVSYKIERKYRLNREMQKWERYHNEYKLIAK